MSGDKLSVSVTEWRPLSPPRHTLVGFCDVRIAEMRDGVPIPTRGDGLRGTTQRVNHRDEFTIVILRTAASGR
jgi:hypothetical protein